MFFASFIIRSISATFTEADLPHCDKTEIVDNYQSRILMKRLWKNYTYCIKTVAANGYDGTDLAIAFNDISTAKVSMYLKGLNQDTYTLYEMPSDKTGGAYFHKNSGLITFTSDTNILISIGYTTFQGSCENKLITNHFHFSRLVRMDTEHVYCIFSALPGTQRIKLYSNSSLADFNALLYPRLPKYREIRYYPLDLIIDHSSAVFIQYYVRRYVRKSNSYIKITGNRYSTNLCEHWVSKLSEPQFLSAGHQYALSLGAIIGVCFASLFVLIGLVILIFICFKRHLAEDFFDWFCAPCNCFCEKPTGFDTIVDYSYSD